MSIDNKSLCDGPLQDPILQQGWKTGAIIPELEIEIQRSNSKKFKLHLSNLLALENMLKRHVSLQIMNRIHM